MMILSASFRTAVVGAAVIAVPASSFLQLTAGEAIDDSGGGVGRPGGGGGVGGADMGQTATDDLHEALGKLGNTVRNITPESYAALEGSEGPLNVTNQSDYMDSSTKVELQPYSTAHLLVTSIILGTMILSTIIGNVFVIAAIILERNLHNVGNYLIVSLSVADLMVAALVMPLAAVNEVSRQWFLGSEVCDMFVSFDVLCCTSSILHLVAIAMDRYWAVTQVDYIHNRSAKRILVMIALSWLIGMSISIPPLFGWKDSANDPDESGMCLISQDWGYTIFSTVGAFYLPLFFMLFIYVKVFRAARSRIRKKNFKALGAAAPRPLLSSHANSANAEVTEITVDEQSTTHDGMPLTHISSSNGQSPEHSSVGAQSGHSNGSAVHLTSIAGDSGRNNNKQHLSPHLNLAQSTETLSPPASPLLVKESGSHGMKGSFLDITKVYFDLKKGGKGSVDSPKKKEKEARAARDRLEQKRERKAARTLAIITGSFVCCWLPFFIIALVRPFCQESCHFPQLLVSIIGWLGYFNSLLNPVIYTVFNPDFRNAFRKILFGKYRGQMRHGRR